MQLTPQETLFLDRMACHMIATGDLNIERAGLAVLVRDKELLQACILRSEVVAKSVGDRVYGTINASYRRRSMSQVDGKSVMLLAGQLDSSFLKYQVDGVDVYVSRDDVSLHMRGICKPGCLRCKLQQLIDRN